MVMSTFFSCMDGGCLLVDTMDLATVMGQSFCIHKRQELLFWNPVRCSSGRTNTGTLDVGRGDRADEGAPTHSTDDIARG